MIVIGQMNLADARAELRISQVALARAADLSNAVIVRAEKGLPIQRISAHAILHALNDFRKGASLPPLSIGDLDWKIVGE
jgi:predicted transcriptional regulator